MERTMRKIIHLDMDAFYTSVEVLKNPSLKGKAIAVGGKPQQRGVIATASYEARKYRVHSAMSSARAMKLCPHLILIPPHFDRYKEISQKIYQTCSKYTSVIETVALDEAWLDVTEQVSPSFSVITIARKIQEEILKKFHLSCSIGISYNKFLSKLASEEKKPAGFFVIRPSQAHDFLMSLPLRKFPGIGKVTAEKFYVMNIQTGKDLYEKSEDFLIEKFGRIGTLFYQRIRGIDDREVQNFHQRQSISEEHTFENDVLPCSNILIKKIEYQIKKLHNFLDNQSFFARTLSLKIKFSDFQIVSRSVTHSFFFNVTTAREYTTFLLKTLCSQFPNKKIRLIGIRLSNLTENGYYVSQFPLKRNF